MTKHWKVQVLCKCNNTKELFIFNYKILAIYILFYELVFESKSFVFDKLSKIDLGKYSMNTPQHGRNSVIAFTKHPGFRFGKPDYLK